LSHHKLNGKSAQSATRCAFSPGYRTSGNFSLLAEGMEAGIRRVMTTPDEGK